MKGNWKADEMEMSINFKAMRVALLFSMLALATWVIVIVVKTKELASTPFIILLLQNLIFFFSKSVITRRMVGKDKKND